jgi:extracellular elastinolytic metalloproteinase
MGYFAGAVNGDDAQPVEDFSLPPVAGTPHGYLIGAVTDADSGAPAVGVTVAFGGHASGFPGDYEAVTGADGTYRITGVYAGTYPKVWAGGGGFDRKVRTLSATSGRQTLNWTLRRDWAARAGGASVTDTNVDTGAPYGCGAAAMFDQSQARGWSAERHVVNGVVIPVHVVVELPSAVDVSQVAIDPSGTCGDDPSAAAGPYTLETSTDGTTWTTAASGTFAPADDSRFNSPALAPGSTSGVRYLRYTVKDSQADQVGSCPSDLSGCAFIDSTELEVYGTPPS